MIAVRLPKEIESRLDNLAKLTGRTKTFYVREAILDHRFGRHLHCRETFKNTRRNHSSGISDRGRKQCGALNLISVLPGN